MTTPRTDIHRPVNLDPEAYRYLLAIDNNPDPGFGVGWVLAHGDWGLELSRRVHAGPLGDRGVFACHHCGARIRYAALLEHIPTGDVIAVGETCLDGRFDTGLTKAEFAKLRKSAKLDRKKLAREAAAEKRVLELGGAVGEALDRDTDLTEAFDLDAYALNTITDIRAKLWKWGEVSDKAAAFVGRLIEEAPAKREREKERARATEVANAAGFIGEIKDRLEVGIEVVFTKWIDSHFGASRLVIGKVLDGAHAGAKVKTFNSGKFGEEVETGDRIVVKGTVKDHEVYDGEKATMLTRVAKVRDWDGVCPLAEAEALAPSEESVANATAAEGRGRARFCEEFIASDVDTDTICENCRGHFADHASECMEFGSGDCAGEVGWHSLDPGMTKAFPRCDYHWGVRLDRRENSIEKYANSDVAPGWFDPSYAGEEW